jgi:hypothetical protein
MQGCFLGLVILTQGKDDSKEKTTPWNFNQMEKYILSYQPALAVDKSIWIHKELTSTAMTEKNAKYPTLGLIGMISLKSSTTECSL